MPKIVSRLNNDQARIVALQGILADAADGALGLPGSGALIDLETDLDGLIDQTEKVLETLHDVVEALHLRTQIIAADMIIMAMELDATQDALANLVGNIDYDDAMDHATADLMDCFAASGAADVNADGDLAFDARVTFSKADLKPILREAIVRWIEVKMSQ
jgi:hypothetical protein